MARGSVLPMLARKKKAKKSLEKLAKFLGEWTKKNYRFCHFQKKKSQVIFLASQFFSLAGIDLFCPVLICISLLKICKSLMGDELSVEHQ